MERFLLAMFLASVFSIIIAFNAVEARQDLGVGTAVTVTVTRAPGIDIHSPINTTYNQRKVWVNVSAPEQMKKIYKALNSNRFSTLCRNCDSKNRTYSMREGLNALTIKTLGYDDSEMNETVYFSVDYREPRIKRVYPRRGSVVPGISNFTVMYREDTVSNVSLYYGIGPMEEFFMDYCTDGRKVECTATVNVSDYHGAEIQYYFVVRSPFFEVESKHYNVTVDSIAPIVDVHLPENKTYNSRRVEFNISVSEDVKLEYSDNGGRWRRLCGRCDSYTRRKYFSYDGHEVLVRATDKAGNVGYAEVVFTASSL